MKKRIISIIISCILVLSGLTGLVYAQEETEAQSDIVILTTSDVHCAVDGYAKLMTYRNQTEELYGEQNVVMADAGDAFQGDYIGYFDKGMSIASIVNKLDYCMMVPGNHDFDYTADHYFSKSGIVGKLETTVVSCNISKNGTPELEPYVIVSVGNKKIAFIGITTPATLVQSQPTNFQDETGKIVYDFCNDSTGEKLYAKVRETVEAARADAAKPDYVIAVGHLGNEGGEDYVWDSSDVIAHTNGIDAFVDGHAHQSLSNSFKNKDGVDVPIVATSDKLANIGKIIIHSDGSIETTVVETSGITVDEDDNEVKSLNNVISEAKNKVDQDKKKLIGESLVKLTIMDENGKRAVRSRETNAADFVTDAYRIVTGADVGIVNGGGVRADIEKGNITFGDVFGLNPFCNELCVCNIKGQAIIDALECGARTAPDSEQGGFLQVSGLTYKIDPSIKSSVVMDENANFKEICGERRVYDVKVGGRAIDPNGYYSVAGSTYLLKNGGDGFTMFKGSKVLKEEIMLDSEALIEYVQDDLNGIIGTDYAAPQGRITFAEKPVTPSDNDNKEYGGKGTKTGDEHQLSLYVIFALLSAFGATLFIARKGRKQ